MTREDIIRRAKRTAAHLRAEFKLDGDATKHEAAKAIEALVEIANGRR